MAPSKEELRRILGTELQRRKVMNPLYSLRAFAKQMDLSPGAFSQILSGKRNIGPKTFRKLKMAADEIALTSQMRPPSFTSGNEEVRTEQSALA